MRIIFMGTPIFAVPSLEILIKNGYQVVAVVTQPDKPKGRGNKLCAPPVKELALQYGIEVLQPQKVRTPEYVEQLAAFKPDLFVTVAYGRLLTKQVLQVPPMGCINVHGSLLPQYRGAAPIQWSIIQGEATTGITTMYTDVGLDTGDMLLKKEVPIGEDMTAGALHDVLSVVGAELLLETLQALQKGELTPIPQNNDAASLAPVISKETGLIDWSTAAKQIHDLVRGTCPWPGAYTFYQGQRMRVWKTMVDPLDSKQTHGQSGKILKVDRDGILVAAQIGRVKILEIQFDSGRRMCIEEYICGHRIDEGELLG